MATTPIANNSPDLNTTVDAWNKNLLQGKEFYDLQVKMDLESQKLMFASAVETKTNSLLMSTIQNIR